MSDIEKVLKKLRIRLDEMERAGLQDTPEYEKVSDEYQDLTLDLITDQILGDVDEWDA